MSLTRNFETSDSQATSFCPSLPRNDTLSQATLAWSGSMLGASHQGYLQTNTGSTTLPSQTSCSSTSPVIPGSSLNPAGATSLAGCYESADMTEELSLKERFTKMRSKYMREGSSEEDEIVNRESDNTSPCKRRRYEAATASDDDDMNECSQDSCTSSLTVNSSCTREDTSKATTSSTPQPQSANPANASNEKENSYHRKADDTLRRALLGPSTTSNTASRSYDKIRIPSNFWLQSHQITSPPSTSNLPSLNNFQFTPKVLSPISQIVAAQSAAEPRPTPAASAEDAVENYQELLATLVTRASIKSTRLNLKAVNLVRKETLLSLIDRNRRNSLLAPFDLFAYTRIKSKQNSELLVDSMNNLNIRSFSMATSLSHGQNPQLNTSASDDVYEGNTYNYAIVHKLDKLRKYYKPNDKNYMKENCLILNCVSSYLMPFFFDIFNASELQSFNKETVDMLLLLKRTYKAQESPDYELLTSNYIENILWNCFALYKFKFDDDKQTRMGLLNYYLTYVSMLNEFETLLRRAERSGQDQAAASSSSTGTKSYSKKHEELKSILPFLLESLVLNGLFKSSDLTQFQRFYTSKRLSKGASRRTAQFARESPSDDRRDDFFSDDERALSSDQERLSVDLIPTTANTPSSFEASYLDTAMRNMLNKEETSFPLKLKNLCRISIKNSMKEFTPESVNSLNIPSSMKPFLLYDDEVSLLFRFNKRFMSTSASKCSWY